MESDCRSELERRKVRHQLDEVLGGARQKQDDDGADDHRLMNAGLGSSARAAPIIGAPATGAFLAPWRGALV